MHIYIYICIYTYMHAYMYMYVLVGPNLTEQMHHIHVPLRRPQDQGGVSSMVPLVLAVNYGVD